MPIYMPNKCNCVFSVNTFGANVMVTGDKDVGQIPCFHRSPLHVLLVVYLYVHVRGSREFRSIKHGL